MFGDARLLFRSMEPTSRNPADLSPSGIRVQGTVCVSGVTYGPAHWVRDRPELPVSGEVIPEDARSTESERFLAAVDTVAYRFRTRADATTGEAAEVLRAGMVMVKDPAWSRSVQEGIRIGHPVAVAVAQATGKFSGMFARVGGATAERITDLEDLRDRVIAELNGAAEPGLPALSEPVVLLAEDLSPADTATLDPARVLALVTVRGGRTSHTAIIAGQLGIPCIVATGAGLRQFRDGTAVLVEGDTGLLRSGVDPESARVILQRAAEKSRRIDRWQGPARTRDGHRVALRASVTSGAGARGAAIAGAEGIGLFRTEVPFLRNRREPTVQEQGRIYAEVLAAFPGEPVIFRTFDAGSDKPLAFLNLGEEENPALGVRGLRVAREHPHQLMKQLDALAGAGAGRAEPVSVMAPMLSTVTEAESFARLCRDRGLSPGVMIEVPAAALLADQIMPHLDFVSLGTNDLAQYVMAADRMSPELVDFADPWQPAVLRLVQHVCREGRELGVPVGVCGEAATDPHLACVLVGMGVSSLSSTPAALPAVGEQLSRVSLAECLPAATAVLQAATAKQAREVGEKLLGAAGAGENLG